MSDEKLIQEEFERFKTEYGFTDSELDGLTVFKMMQPKLLSYRTENRFLKSWSNYDDPITRRFVTTTIQLEDKIKNIKSRLSFCLTILHEISRNESREGKLASDCIQKIAKMENNPMRFSLL